MVNRLTGCLGSIKGLNRLIFGNNNHSIFRPNSEEGGGGTEFGLDMRMPNGKWFQIGQ